MKLNSITALLIAMPISAYAAGFNQAPVLDTLVEAGKLPPVDQRLPENPLIVTPVESIGEYGGTLNLLSQTTDNGHSIRVLGYENLFSFDSRYTKVVPHLALSFSANDDNTEFTINLREKVRWSDGELFTAHDIAFLINDVLGDPEYAGPRPLVLPKFDSAYVDVIDDYSFKITLKEPNGMFIRSLASVDSQVFTMYPKHYCKDFFPSFNSKAAEQAKQVGFDSWRQYASTKCNSHYVTEGWTNVDKPVLSAWKVKVPRGPNAEYALYERNPYYWQVDSEGNQLPYLDNLRFSFSENKEEMALRAAAGKTDYQARHIGSPNYRPMLIENEDKGGYNYEFRPSTDSSSLVIALNQSHKDPIKRELFSNKDFRIALSHAIDRDAISETVYGGTVDPHQAAPTEGSPFYRSEMVTQYTAFDPEKANAILDKLGLDKRDDEGYRLDKTGKRLRIEALTYTTLVGDGFDSLELIKSHWKDVGVFLDIRLLDSQHISNQRLTNSFDLIPLKGVGGKGVIDDPRNYLPYSTESTWAFGYYLWSNNPEDPNGVEPPAHIKKQLELWKKIENTSSEKEQIKYMQQVIDIAHENFYVIGTVEALSQGVIVNKNLRNVDHKMPQSWVFPTPGPLRLGQLWKADKK
ncbi:peptide ABC transporter substrate-binding protein [Vibrio variabilis]|uniref:Peptide ABC transporter substrate-binding protein n=2 Tax=Vibrio TaxID=662 RepID=A0ABR4YGA9_9VIBR|nr:MULTISPECIES: ABC transporter substrate-binding protein [Vibrio]KHA62315.1 peptide ABC transporter substrate-binding protein [Vibrio variabilis]KHD26385.1 peptide ABC transporter substrate-binding protein [Vibrio caribbeanicus]